MKKEKLTYHFSVEGESEKRYLDWLQRAINAEQRAKYMVKMDVKIQSDPVKRMKGMVVLGRTQITHVFDREGNDDVHARRFEMTLQRMKKAQDMGKNIRYTLGYSNFTFELWMILHKADCFAAKTHRGQYLAPLNQAYGQNFESLDQYKREGNFQRILDALTLEDVRDAIRRGEMITRRNQEQGFVLQKQSGYSYYLENPSLSLWEVVKAIFTDCKL